MLEYINVEGTGFKELKDFQDWRIAQIGYEKSIGSIENIKTFGRHAATDETFLLLEGKGVMFTAGFDKTFGDIEVDELEKGKLCTVKQNQWHTIMLEPDSRVLIVENSNTCNENTTTHTITDEERNKIKKLKRYK